MQNNRIIDSTRLKEDNASYYYAKRSGKKSWTKMTVVADVESQTILAEDAMGTGNDGIEGDV